MKTNVNIKYARKCAFCKFWYDPTNSNIQPVSPKIGIWQINDTNMRCMCLKKNLQVPAHTSCQMYQGQV